MAQRVAHRPRGVGHHQRATSGRIRISDIRSMCVGLVAASMGLMMVLVWRLSTLSHDMNVNGQWHGMRQSARLAPHSPIEHKWQIVSPIPEEDSNSLALTVERFSPHTFYPDDTTVPRGRSNHDRHLQSNSSNRFPELIRWRIVGSAGATIRSGPSLETPFVALLPHNSILVANVSTIQSWRGRGSNTFARHRLFVTEPMIGWASVAVGTTKILQPMNLTWEEARNDVFRRKETEREQQKRAQEIEKRRAHEKQEVREASACTETGIWLQDTDMKGGDLPRNALTSDVKDAKACCLLCKDQASVEVTGLCLGWTYVVRFFGHL